MTILSQGKSWAITTAAAAACAVGLSAGAATAADWSVTEIQYQYGKLNTLPFAGGGEHATNIVTLQHASGYSFGDVFFFVDFIDDETADGFNDNDAYGELYTYWSSSKILGATYGGPIKDIGVVLGINYGADSDYLSYLPGGYIDWNVPQFAFLRTQVTAVVDDSGPLITQGDGWQFDISWGLPFQIAGQRFSFEGHAEYTGTKDKDWILAQPQLRWDAGYAFTGKKDVLFLGTEYQYWENKLGTDVDESAFQALAVWRF